MSHAVHVGAQATLLGISGTLEDRPDFTETIMSPPRQHQVATLLGGSLVQRKNHKYTEGDLGLALIFPAEKASTPPAQITTEPTLGIPRCNADNLATGGLAQKFSPKSKSPVHTSK